MTEKERQEAIERQLREANRVRSIVEKAPEVAQRNERAFSVEQLERGVKRGKAERMSWGETIDDAIRSGVTGAAKGVISAPGAPFDIVRLGQLARAYTDTRAWNPFAPASTRGQPFTETLAKQDLEREAGQRGFLPLAPPSQLEKYGGQAYIDAAKPSLPGLGYEPKTLPGEFAETAGEVAGGGVVGELPMAVRAGTRYGLTAARREAQRAARVNAATGAAVGAADVASEGSPGWQIAAGLVAGPLANAYGTKSAEEAIRSRITSESRINPNQVRQAEDLVQAARDRGLALSRANALDWVTGGDARGLSELQRVVESASPEMLRFFADNAPTGPSRARLAVERQLGRIAPQSGEPQTIGPRVGEIMNREIDQARQASNVDYANTMSVVGQNRVDPAQLQAAMQNPVWAREYQNLMNDPELEPFLRGRAPDSVEVVELVNRLVRERQQTRATPGETSEGSSATRAEGIRQQLPEGELAANEGSRMIGPQLPGHPTPLEQAQQQRAINQRTMVDPLEYGPEGQMAGPPGSVTTPKVHTTLQGGGVEGNAPNIGRAVGTIAQADPDLASEMVRNYIGTVAENTMGPNIAGEPYTAGSKFWKTLGGAAGSETRDTLQQIMTNLPNGQAAWQGMQELGQIFEAQGRRQAPGSKTAFNEKDLKELSSSGYSGAAIQLMGTDFSALGRATKDAWERWRLGSNAEDITRLLTDRRAGAEFAAILEQTAPGSVERLMRYSQLLQGFQLAQSGREAVESPLTQPPGSSQ